MLDKFVKKLVWNYLSKMYAETDDKVLKGAITKVLQRL